MELTNQEVARYSRHLIMPEVGPAGQKKLKAAKVLLIGSGGLGSPLALYLSAAGVGKLGLVDFDVVDFSNLHRQVIHFTDDVGKLKVESAKEKIGKINPEVEVQTYNTRLSRSNIMDIMEPYDIVIDGTDNFQTRYLVNDACVFLKKPNVYGSIFRFDGQASVFYPYEGPCYRCMFPEPPPPGMVPSCAEGGVLGILPGVIGLIQATEAIKLIIGQGQPLIGRLLTFNALDMRWRELKLQRDPKCPVCGENPTVTELIDYDQFCGLGRGEEGGAGDVGQMQTITPKELQQELSNGKKVVLLDVREPQEYEITHLENSRLIPLGEVAERANQLDTADDIVVYCHHGMRSANAIGILKRFGFAKLRNLTGGIDAWAASVDPDMPRY